MNELVAFSADGWPQVETEAQAALAQLPVQRMASTLEETIIALPQTILSHGNNKARMTQAVKLLRGASKCATLGHVAHLFERPDSGIERWSWLLLRAR